MATKLLHRRSSNTGHVPSTNQLELGEIAINTADGFLYLKKDDGTNPEEIYRLRGEPLTNIAVINDTFSGDDSTTAFTLSRFPEDEQFAFVFINGVLQHTNVYSITAGVLSFTSPPATGDNIEVRIFSVRSSALELRDYKTYVYTISSSTSVISGGDDAGEILEFDQEKAEVYFNGVRLVRGYDWYGSGGTTINFYAPIEDGTIEVVSLSKASFVDQNKISSYDKTVSTTSATLVDKFSSNDYRSARYNVQMTYGTDYHVTEVMVLHDGTDVYINEYGTIYTNSSLGTVSADMVNGYVRLLVTPTNSNTVVKGHRMTITV